MSTPIQTRTFELKPGDAIDHLQLGFMAYSIAIDNPTDHQ